MREIREKRQYLKRMNRKFPAHLAEVNEAEWPAWPFESPPPVRVLRSRDFLMQIFDYEGPVRLSVCRTAIADSGRWDDQITWDELQCLKREAGYGDRFAVEVYPEDVNLVDVANMRHLWVLNERLPFAWLRGGRARKA